MSKGKILIVPILTKVFLPGSSLTLSLSNYPSCNIQAVIQGKKLKYFGVTTYKDLDKKSFYSYGTLVGVLSEASTNTEGLFSNISLESNRKVWKVAVIGIERFKILNFSRENGNFYANIQVVQDKTSNIDSNTLENLKTLGKTYLRLSAVSEFMSNERENFIDIESDPSQLGFYIAEHLEIPMQEKQDLLENLDLESRSKKIIFHLQNLLSEDQLSKELTEKLKKTVAKKIQMKKTDEGLENNRTSLTEKLSELELPLEFKNNLIQEASYLSSLNKMHPEHSVLRKYFDIVLSLPWKTSSTDNYDIQNAKNQLDSDHFGLDKVKRRILEYIAVRGLRNDMKGSILCFIGPPGIGKTSLGKSISEAIGRKFIRISLGGVRDEADIRGHRRTYVAAMPGLLISAFKRCGTNNPVILLDEIDKLGQGLHGDPASALLEVLDPAQNSNFIDHYLGVPFDLSKVLFIATANKMDSIPYVLLDRMEVIEITGYSVHEKLKIATNYLIPKQITENGLRADVLDIPENVVFKIISDYTRESGVRELDRNLAAVCRWTAMELYTTKKSAQFTVRENQLEDILGIQKYTNDTSERVLIPGIAIGLAWTVVGGKILFVESSKCPGQGNLKVTGKLGDVMKESVVTCVSWIKVNLPEILPKTQNSKCDGFDGIDVHIHFPAAAVPKDGPSAGITITTALVSLLTGVKVRNDLAMTGEISLSGKVLPIGGVKEKVLGAHRMGIKTVVLPKLNRKDLKDVPENVLKEMEVVFVDRIKEVLGIALEGGLSNIFIKI